MITSIGNDQIEVRRGYMLMAKVAIKQPNVMILETPEEWYKRTKWRIECKGETVKVELDGSKKTTLAGAKLTELEVARITKLLRKNKAEFVLSLVDMLMTVYRLNLDPNAKKIT